MTTAYYEYWWQVTGRFNTNLYDNYLRAKMYAEFQSNLQDKGCQVDHPGENNPSKQSRGCHQEDGSMATINHKN
jgi:hypothetical protein